MLKFVNARLASGTVFSDEADLARYLRRLGGYLKAKKGYKDVYIQNQKKYVLRLFREGKLNKTADATPTVS